MLIKDPDPLFKPYSKRPNLATCDHIAGSLKFAEKAIQIQEELADSASSSPLDITLDMEDGAQVGNERALLKDFISLINSPLNKYKQLGIRIHDLESTFWRDELREIVKEAGEAVAYIKIPKIQSASELQIIRDFIAKDLGLKSALPLHAVVESIKAFNQLDLIASDPWVSVLDFGLMDFISDHAGLISDACMKSPGQFEHELIKRAKVDLVMACVRHNKIASHNVTVLVKDLETTKNDALIAKNSFGFSRMWSVHPGQIKPVIEAFSVSTSELEEAKVIIREAEKANFGPIFFGGRLHDRASFRYYADLIKRAS